MRWLPLVLLILLMPVLAYDQTSPGTINSKLQDGSGTKLTSTNVSGKQGLDVNVITPGGGGSAVSVADGADVAEGATTDAAITSNTTGTVSGKLRGLVAILADVWDSVNHRLNVFIANATLAVTQSGTWNIGTLTSITNTVTVGGTVTTSPPSNASTNIAQINGITPLMGNGATGTGSPRVTIASDNTAFSVNNTQQGTAAQNITQFGGTNLSTGTGASGTGIPRVTVANDSNVLATQSGTWTDRIVGNAGATLDAANNAALATNNLLIGVEALSTQPAAATTGNQRRLVAALDGSLVVRPFGLITWSCNLNAIAATLTECQAVPGAGLSLYITDVLAQSNTSTAGTFTLRFGTGTNCGTGTGNLYFGLATAVLFLPANTALPQQWHYNTPIKVTANNAVCVLGVATNTTNIQINGFTAP